VSSITDTVAGKAAFADFTSCLQCDSRILYTISSVGDLFASVPALPPLTSENRLTSQIADTCERIASAILLTTLSPVLVTSAAAIALMSGRTPLIAHRRVGQYGRALWMLKLRTMWDRPSQSSSQPLCWVECVDDDIGPEAKCDGDPRVRNAVARFCRRHSIDEIPQLFHVIRGQMSLVGPRPLTASEVGKIYGADAEEILQAKPGLAGLWQVSGRNRLSSGERRKLDLILVRSRSFGLYIRILLRTIPEVFSGKNSW
jgi:exopolysaccharide production protein ExoY